VSEYSEAFTEEDGDLIFSHTKIILRKGGKVVENEEVEAEEVEKAKGCEW
jgi:hypothetical protein